MEKGELLNKLFESGIKGDEAQAIASSDVWPKVHSSFCGCGDCMAWQAGEVEEQREPKVVEDTYTGDDIYSID